MEQINRERNILKNTKEDELNFVKNAGEYAYCEALLSYKDNKGVAKRSKKSTSIKTKIRNLNTFNIIYFVHTSLKAIDKAFVKKLDKIKAELLKRDDLFSSVIEYFEWCTSYEDDLYCWYPGLKTCDIFSFIIDLIPNIVPMYKDYYTRTLILGQPPKSKILDFLKDRINTNLSCFEIIMKDQKYFAEKVVESLQPLVDNSIVNKNESINFLNESSYSEYKIITGLYWKNDENDEEEKCVNAIEFIGGIEKRKRYNQNINLEIIPSLSFVDIEIDNKVFTLSLQLLDDLLTKNNRSKALLIEMGIIDDNWNLL